RRGQRRRVTGDFDQWQQQECARGGEHGQAPRPAGDRPDGAHWDTADTTRRHRDRDSRWPLCGPRAGAAHQGDPYPDRTRRAASRRQESTLMPKRSDLKSILIIGAGPIVIGQACEFDYSGAQACKALKQEGYRVILVNSNPATIMTDP